MFMFCVPVTLCNRAICCSHFDAVCYKSLLGSPRKATDFYCRKCTVFAVCGYIAVAV